jgi:hypothetical protein
MANNSAALRRSTTVSSFATRPGNGNAGRNLVRITLLFLCLLSGLAWGEVKVEVAPLYSLHLGSEIHSQGHGTIERQWTSPIAGGGGMQLNYEGRDATGRAFRYTGFLSEQKLISVYLEMPVRSAANRAALMDAIVQRVKY